MLIATAARDEDHRQATLTAYAAAVCAAMDAIDAALPDGLELDDLSRHVGFSPYWFHRVFTALLGETPGAYARRARLAWAAGRLRSGGQSITELALECGYATPSAFTRAFRQVFGRAPSELRGDEPARRRVAPGELVDRWRAAKELTMNLEIRDFEPRTVAYVRHVGPYEGVGRAWGKLMMWAGMNRLLKGAPELLGISYDDPHLVAPERLRHDACVVVPAGTQGKGDVGIREIAGGRYAVARHVGPYSRLDETYTALLRDWLPGSGHSPRDEPCLEFYRNDPRQTPEAELITDVCVAIS